MTNQLPVGDNTQLTLLNKMRANFTCKRAAMLLSIMAGIYFWFAPEQMAVVLNAIWSIIY